MKKTYPALTFLTGLLLVAGVLFVRFYGSLTGASSGAVASNDQPIAVATSAPSGNAPSGSAMTDSAPASSGSSGSSGSAHSAASKPASGSSSNTSGFTNGTYSATADYDSPQGTESIAVSLTISDGVVTDTSVTNSAYGGSSRRYQSAFASSYRSYVVGKSIASLQLNNVAGASLTTDAFDQAVAQIRSEAAA